MGRARDRASADLNGQEFILDADADTSISADTDDQIDIKIAGAMTSVSSPFQNSIGFTSIMLLLMSSLLMLVLQFLRQLLVMLLLTLALIYFHLLTKVLALGHLHQHGLL